MITNMQNPKDNVWI